MTLRRYFVLKNNNKNDELFYRDSEALFAESWDAEAFAKRFFNKSLKFVSFNDMYSVFRALIEEIDRLSETDQYKEQNDTIIDLGNGNSMKKKIVFNPFTYDQDTTEDDD